MPTRNRYSPRPNTPKSDRDREQLAPIPPLGPVAVTLMGHRPRHRRLGSTVRGQHAYSPRERAIVRLARGLNVPVTLLSEGRQSHWSLTQPVADAEVDEILAMAAAYRAAVRLPPNAPVQVAGAMPLLPSQSQIVADAKSAAARAAAADATQKRRADDESAAVLKESKRRRFFGRRHLPRAR